MELYDFKSLKISYELKINNINLELEKSYIKQEIEEEHGEFGSKLYEYIYKPSLEEKYDLMKQLLGNLITPEQSENLKAEHISLKYGDKEYEHCIEIKNAANDTNQTEMKANTIYQEDEQYYCYDSNNKSLEHVLLGNYGEVRVIDVL